MMAEGIGEFAVAIAPKLICEGHVHASARGDGAVESRVYVLEIEEESAGIHGSRRWRSGHAGEFVGQHDMGVADFYFGVHDSAIGTGHAHDFRGTEDRFVEINGLG